MKRIAGIVLYNPEVERLKENIGAIIPQVDELLLVENGSCDTSFLNQFEDIEKVVIIRNNGSKGVAYALNQILEYASINGYEWALTLDQDSVCPDNLINLYSEYIDDETVGMICPRVKDRNFGEIEYSCQLRSQIVDSAITSASMLRISAWRDCGGFWNDLFIDMVDFDICWSLQEKGYKIVQVNDTVLYHEIGHGKMVRFRGKDVAIYNHSPFRDYYIVRNSIAVGRKHGRLVQCTRWIAKRFFLINRYEKDIFRKDLNMFLGLIHGFCGRLGRR